MFIGKVTVFFNYFVKKTYSKESQETSPFLCLGLEMTMTAVLITGKCPSRGRQQYGA